MIKKFEYKIDNFDIRDIIYLLDIQRGYCIDNGAYFTPGHLWIATKRNYNQELKAQINYYNGHINAIEKLCNVIGCTLTVNNYNHHVITFTEETDGKTYEI